MNGLPGNLQPRHTPDAAILTGIGDLGGRAILLTKGKIAIVDSDGRKICILMHREILDLGRDNKCLVDHIDRNGLNNKKLNLRQASKSLNSYNCKTYCNNKSKYRGVVWDKNRKLWRSKIMVLGQTKNLGRYVDPVEAAKAFDRAAISYRGETAILNFPIGDQL